METVIELAQKRLDDAATENFRLQETLEAERAARRVEKIGILEELIAARRALVESEARQNGTPGPCPSRSPGQSGGARDPSKNEEYLRDAVSRLSLLQWLGDSDRHAPEARPDGRASPTSHDLLNVRRSRVASRDLRVDGGEAAYLGFQVEEKPPRATASHLDVDTIARFEA